MPKKIYQRAALTRLFATLFVSISLLSCQQFRLGSVADYSGLLPPQQLLYISIRQAASFPYQQFQAHFLESKELQKFVSKRLQRSQLALGSRGEIYAINQLLLNDKFFARQMAQQADWNAIPKLSAAYSHSDKQLALQMPQANLLYFSKGTKKITPQFGKLWQTVPKHSELPRRFLELQDNNPFVAYSPQVISLIVNPWLQQAFPQALRLFANMSRRFPVSQMLVWIEINSKGLYTLHLELPTSSLLLSKSLKAGFRLFLPGLLLRSKQEFIRRQWPNVLLESDKQSFHLQMPLDQASLLHIIGQLKI